MDIQPISNNKFVVGLTKADMAELDITYDDMDYSNIETRRVIWTILEEVRQFTGKDVDPSGNLMIEAAPDCRGGCILMFTIPVSSVKTAITGTIISRVSPTQIYEFNSLDDLLDALKIIGVDSMRNSIYANGGNFRAEISADKANAYNHILDEYGKLIGKDLLTLAVTQEHWTKL